MGVRRSEGGLGRHLARDPPLLKVSVTDVIKPACSCVVTGVRAGSARSGSSRGGVMKSQLWMRSSVVVGVVLTVATGFAPASIAGAGSDPTITVDPAEVVA